jgi:hypothetical protein
MKPRFRPTILPAAHGAFAPGLPRIRSVKNAGDRGQDRRGAFRAYGLSTADIPENGEILCILDQLNTETVWKEDLKELTI